MKVAETLKMSPDGAVDGGGEATGPGHGAKLSQKLGVEGKRDLFP
jgi:hypothetical protein